MGQSIATQSNHLNDRLMRGNSREVAQSVDIALGANSSGVMGNDSQEIDVSLILSCLVLPCLFTQVTDGPLIRCDISHSTLLRIIEFPKPDRTQVLKVKSKVLIVISPKLKTCTLPTGKFVNKFFEKCQSL